MGFKFQWLVGLGSPLGKKFIVIPTRLWQAWKERHRFPSLKVNARANANEWEIRKRKPSSENKLGKRKNLIGNKI